MNAQPAPRLSLEPWPEAETLFRDDPRWRGGDDAYSLPLGGGRHLWLFGDTFLVPNGDGDRTTASFVHNTVGVQSGDDPASASLAFHWAEREGRPAAVFDDHEPPVYLWPGDAVVVDDRALVFFMRIAVGAGPADPDDPETVANFRVVGWTARTLDGLDGLPDSWRVGMPALPDTPGLAVGFGGVIGHADHVYAHAIGSADRTGTLVARWPNAAVAAGDLTAPSWWSGPANAWTHDQGAAVPTGLRALTEFTVHHDAPRDRFLAVQMTGLRSATLEVRAAPAVTGPWSDPVVWRPPLADDPAVTIYAGKAHPDIADDRGILITYATNGVDLATVVGRDDLYYPHCLRLVAE